MPRFAWRDTLRGRLRGRQPPAKGGALNSNDYRAAGEAAAAVAAPSD